MRPWGRALEAPLDDSPRCRSLVAGRSISEPRNQFRLQSLQHSSKGRQVHLRLFHDLRNRWPLDVQGARDIGQSFAGDLPKFTQTFDLILHLAIASVDANLTIERQVGDDLVYFRTHFPNGPRSTTAAVCVRSRPAAGPKCPAGEKPPVRAPLSARFDTAAVC